MSVQKEPTRAGSFSKAAFPIHHDILPADRPLSISFPLALTLDKSEEIPPDNL
jgi:hypothetical protein